MTEDQWKGRSKRGYMYVIMAAFLWASSGCAAKFLFNGGVSPFQLVQLRITIATIVLFAFLAVKRPNLLKIAKKDIFYFIVLGTLGMASAQFFYLFAISKINVSAAILLEYLSPTLIALYMILFAGEKPDRLTLSAIGAAFAGACLATGAWRLDILTMNMAGIVSGLFSAVAFAWHSVHGEYGMRRYDPWTVLFYALLVGAVIWNAIIPPLDSFFQAYSPMKWMVILYVGTFGTVVPFALYFKGINLIRSPGACATATLEPIIAGILCHFFLNEPITPPQVAGGLLVIGSIILLMSKTTHDPNTPEAMRCPGKMR